MEAPFAEPKPADDLISHACQNQSRAGSPKYGMFHPMIGARSRARQSHHEAVLPRLRNRTGLGILEKMGQLDLIATYEVVTRASELLLSQRCWGGLQMDKHQWRDGTDPVTDEPPLRPRGRILAVFDCRDE
jgi:hypothetical protein